METILKKSSKSHIKLTVKISREEVEKDLNLAYEKIGSTLKIDGFRPGKAPKKIIEEQAGQARIIQETIDLAMEKSYPAALKKENVFPVNQPKITVDVFPTLQEGGLEYTAEFDAVPEVKLKDYSKITVKKIKTEEVKESDVAKILEYLQKQKATFKEVNRGAKNGDRLEINFSGTVKGVPKDGMQSKNHPIILGEGVMIKGFEEELLGLKKSEKKKFKVRFPKDYHAKDLANQEAEFEVEVVDHKEVVLPEVDEKLAADFGHKNVVEMKKAIGESLKKEIEEKAKNDQEMQVIDKLLPLLTIDLPEALIDQEVDRMIETFRQQVESKGMNFERYLESIKKDVSAMRQEVRAQAEKNVKIGFMIGEVIKELKLDIHKEESGRKAMEHLIKQIVKSP